MKHLRTSYPSLDIEVDGGVGPATIEAAAEVTKSLYQDVCLSFYISPSLRRELI